MGVMLGVFRSDGAEQRFALTVAAQLLRHEPAQAPALRIERSRDMRGQKHIVEPPESRIGGSRLGMGDVEQSGQIGACR